MFFDAASYLIRKKPDLKIVFAVIGDGELRKELEAHIQKQNLNEYVKFCGWTKNVAMVYNDIDVLALTSLNEGTPVSIIEAMASSVPVISTNAGGVIDLIGMPDKAYPSNGFKICERGVLCRSNDSVEFSNGLKWLIENRKIAQKTFVERARIFVNDRYTQKRLIRNVEKLYTELVQ